jgi:hypothetical protein
VTPSTRPDYIPPAGLCKASGQPAHPEKGKGPRAATASKVLADAAPGGRKPLLKERGSPRCCGRNRAQAECRQRHWNAQGIMRLGGRMRRGRCRSRYAGAGRAQQAQNQDRRHAPQGHTERHPVGRGTGMDDLRAAEAALLGRMGSGERRACGKAETAQGSVSDAMAEGIEPDRPWPDTLKD